MIGTAIELLHSSYIYPYPIIMWRTTLSSLAALAQGAPLRITANIRNQISKEEYAVPFHCARENYCSTLKPRNSTFIRKVFSATEIMRSPGPDGSISYAELRMGAPVIIWIRYGHEPV